MTTKTAKKDETAQGAGDTATATAEVKKDEAAQGASDTTTAAADEKKDKAAQGAGETKADKVKPPTKEQAKAIRELEIMTRHKVKTLYRNSKGEYFTSENLANLSETKKENVETITLADATKAAKR